MHARRLAVTRSLLVGVALVFATGCSDSASPAASIPDAGAGTSELGGGGSAVLRIVRAVHNGGQLLPHRVPELDASGFPTGQISEIISLTQIRQSVVRGNPILPTPSLPPAAVLPSGRPGSHFFGVELTSDVDPASVFALPFSTGLTRNVTLARRIAATGMEQPVAARVLVGGVTAVDTPMGPILQRWLRFDESTGRAIALVPEAQGFLNLSRARLRQLLSPRGILLIADTDGDLSTQETFPSGGALQLRLTEGLRNTIGQTLVDPAFVSTHIGVDTDPPEISENDAGGLSVTPKNGEVDVDPETEITVRFTEPVQPALLGAMIGRDEPLLSSFLAVEFGPAQQRAVVPVSFEAVSPYDLSAYRIAPGYAFPGVSPDGVANAFNVIDLGFAMDEVADLAGTPGAGLLASSFTTGMGVGLVNAPVIPEAILALRSHPAGGGDGISVVDLNGFGASTGNPVSSPGIPLKGESRYPFNPNVFLQPGLLPPPGTTTLDGGSAGVFTLTLDNNLADTVMTAPTIESAEDAQVGHALDAVFRNAPPPFGCQAGGGNVCALDGIKVISTVAGPTGVQPNLPVQFGGLVPGYENLVSWSPHPNPPGLSFPPQCVSPLLAANEPVSVTNFNTVQNLLVPGNPFPNPATMIPPTGLLSLVQTSYFLGPELGQTDPLECDIYMMRQQVGHFVYVADRAAGEVVVLNSNRMQVVERIHVGDIGSMAMSPNLDFLAVTNPLSSQVTLIDTDLRSFRFHEIDRTISVGTSPNGIAWSPDNEDILVCNEGSGTLSLIAASSLTVRRTVDVPAGQPFEVAVTPRETLFGLERSVYYGYILSRNGEVSVFESGPDGINGWGFDDVIGTLPYTFQAPKTLQLDLRRALTSVSVVHEGPINLTTGAAGALGDGAISTVEITGGQQGIIHLTAGQMPEFRFITFEVVSSIGASTGGLSGIPTDIAFDEMWNFGGLPATATVFSAGSPLPGNSKSTYRQTSGVINNAVVPRFMLAAVPGAGVIDVVQVEALGSPLFDVDPYDAGTQSIPATGVRALVSFWRQ